MFFTFSSNCLFHHPQSSSRIKEVRRLIQDFLFWTILGWRNKQLPIFHFLFSYSLFIHFNYILILFSWSGSVCVADSTSAKLYRCVCPPAMTGEFCETAVEPLCSELTCKNGACRTPTDGVRSTSKSQSLLLIQMRHFSCCKFRYLRAASVILVITERCVMKIWGRLWGTQALMSAETLSTSAAVIIVFQVRISQYILLIIQSSTCGINVWLSMTQYDWVWRSMTLVNSACLITACDWLGATMTGYDLVWPSMAEYDPVKLSMTQYDLVWPLSIAHILLLAVTE